MICHIGASEKDIRGCTDPISAQQWFEYLSGTYQLDELPKSTSIWLQSHSPNTTCVYLALIVR